MKNWYSSLFRTKDRHAANGDDLPWLASPSVYEHIRLHLDPDSGELAREGRSLPDEERRYRPGEIRFMPGARDGLGGQAVPTREGEKAAEQVARLVAEIAKSNTARAKVALYRLLLKDDVLAYIDPALQAIIRARVSPQPYLRDFALFVAKTAPDRGPVKLAIALLGIIADPRDVELVSLLGRHEEFTLYSAVALTNMLANPEKELWALARRVSGWGRIHLVERLAEDPSPQVQDWLLREGFRNEVMNEYLAYVCAVGGDLRQALYGEVDDDLLRAAGEIIEALIHGGPAEDIQDYPDAAEVINRYLELLEGRAGTVDEFLVVDAISAYLTEDWDPEANLTGGWDPQNRDRAIVAANHILQQPQWRELVLDGLRSADSLEFFKAAEAADILGLDTWPVHWGRLQANPRDSGCWSEVLRKARGEHMDDIIRLAQQALPLAQMTGEPKAESGWGWLRNDDWLSLHLIIHSLAKYPGKGWPLIATALQASNLSNRGIAVAALADWGKANWPPEAAPALAQAIEVEPDAQLRQRMMDLLRERK